MTDNQFQKKFDQMRPALLLDLRASATSFDHEQIMTAFAIHLQEISPMHNCPRWQIIKAARGWSVFLKNFISDEKKLGDAIYLSDKREMIAEIEAEWKAHCAEWAEKEKELDREREAARYPEATRRGYITE